jgi:hypothetical protein
VGGAAAQQGRHSLVSEELYIKKSSAGCGPTWK